MFCPRQLFRALNHCRPRWLSTLQHDSSNILHDPPSMPAMQQPTHANLAMQIMNTANAGNIPMCFQIATKMKLSRIKPDISTYNALMSAVAQDGNSLFSWAILDDMLLVGIKPTVTTFTHLIDVNMAPFHLQVSPLTRISRRNVKFPLDICGMHGAK